MRDNEEWRVGLYREGSDGRRHQSRVSHRERERRVANPAHDVAMNRHYDGKTPGLRILESHGQTLGRRNVVNSKKITLNYISFRFVGHCTWIPGVRSEIYCFASLVDMKTPRVAVGIFTAIIIDTIRYVACLLNFGDKDTGADGVYSARRDVVKLTLFSLETRKTLKSRALGSTAEERVGSCRAGKPAYITAPGSASITYHISVFPREQWHLEAISSSGCTCTERSWRASMNFMSSGKVSPHFATTSLPTSEAPYLPTSSVIDKPLNTPSATTDSWPGMAEISQLSPMSQRGDSMCLSAAILSPPQRTGLK